MYLSCLILNPLNRQVRRDLANPVEMHRTLLKAFPARPGPAAFRSEHGVLYRVDVYPRNRRPHVLIQSQTEPDWSFLNDWPGYLADAGGENPRVKDITGQYAQLKDGQVLAFRLRANATRKIETKTGPDRLRRNGRRVALRTPDALTQWLERKAGAAGFAVSRVQAAPEVADCIIRPEQDQAAFRRASGNSPRQAPMTFGSAVFEGKLRITDRDAFLRALADGIGSAKGYGFGLLSIAPARA